MIKKKTKILATLAPYFMLYSLFAQDLEVDAPSENNADMQIEIPAQEIVEEELKKPEVKEEYAKEPEMGFVIEGQKKKIIKRVTKELSEQIKHVPEHPSFLYETRYIPGMRDADEFLPPKLVKSIIVERLEQQQEDEKNREISLKLKLPNMKQILVVSGFVLVFVLYRMRVSKIKRGGFRG